MNARRATLGCLLCWTALAASSFPTARADDPPKTEGDVEAGKRLISQGDSLADEGKPAEAVLRYKEAFEQLLPSMRKLPFRHEVKREVTAREDMRDFLIAEIDRDMTPEEFRSSESGMKALGFIPPDMDLKAVMVKVYADEIAAFYDPRTKTMHLIKEPETKASKGPGLLGMLLGQKGGFDKEENKTVIAHELTHALADQHYDLKALQDAITSDDDRLLALSALIEGEATLAMLGSQMDDWDGTAIVDLPAADLDRTFSILGPLLPAFGGSNLRSAPPILRESMLFPYLRGLVFCAHLANDGGWKAIDKAYGKPPLSTEQVLHPEKYFKDFDAPQAIDLGTLEPGEGWTELGRNVVGELQLAVLLRRHEGKKAAAGWDGDSFAVFEGPDRRLGLVWRSTWDSDDDAREFATQYARYQTSKLAEGAEEPRGEGEADRLRREKDGVAFLVERQGDDVVVVEGFTTAVAEKLAEAAFKAKTSEKTHDDANVK